MLHYTVHTQLFPKWYVYLLSSLFLNLLLPKQSYIFVKAYVSLCLALYMFPTLKPHPKVPNSMHALMDGRTDGQLVWTCSQTQTVTIAIRVPLHSAVHSSAILHQLFCRIAWLTFYVRVWHKLICVAQRVISSMFFVVVASFTNRWDCCNDTLQWGAYLGDALVRLTCYVASFSCGVTSVCDSYSTCVYHLDVILCRNC